MRQKPSTETKDILAKFIRPTGKFLTYKVMNVQNRITLPTGVYAIAFITALLSGQDPVNINFTKNMRYHLSKCFQQNKFIKFPSVKVSRSVRVFHKTEEEIFCICKGINVGSQMYKCQKCLQFYHDTCVGYLIFSIT